METLKTESKKSWGCGGAEYAKRALTPVSHKSRHRYTTKEEVYTDYSKRQPLANVEVQCTDGTLYFYSCLFEYIEVIRDAIEDGKSQGQIKMECTVETGNNLFNIIKCGKPQKTLTSEQIMNVFDVLHRYNGVDHYLSSLTEWGGVIHRTLAIAVAKYGYDVDSLVFQHRNGQIPVESNDRMPPEWYESIMYYTDGWEFASCINVVLSRVLPYCVVDINYIEKLARRIYKLSYSEYHEVVPVLYTLPNTGSVPILFDCFQEVYWDINHEIDDEIDRPFLTFRDKMARVTATADAKYVPHAAEKFSDAMRDYRKQMEAIHRDESQPFDVFNSWQQYTSRLYEKQRCDVIVDLCLFLQESKADSSVAEWIVGVFRRNPELLNMTSGLGRISHEGLVPYCQRAWIVVQLDLLAAGRCPRSLQFKLAPLG